MTKETSRIDGAAAMAAGRPLAGVSGEQRLGKSAGTRERITLVRAGSVSGGGRLICHRAPGFFSNTSR
jgi:hypothetical protein